MPVELRRTLAVGLTKIGWQLAQEERVNLAPAETAACGLWLSVTAPAYTALSPAEQERFKKQEELEIQRQRQIGAMPRAASRPLTSQPRR